MDWNLGVGAIHEWPLQVEVQCILQILDCRSQIEGVLKIQSEI
jgi:hypothetical protein